MLVKEIELKSHYTQMLYVMGMDLRFFQELDSDPDGWKFLLHSL